jgi:hypothetical protein
MYKKVPSAHYKETNKMIQELQNNKAIINDLKKDIIVENTPLEKLLQLSEYEKNSTIYQSVYNKIIQVEEYENP